MTRILDGKAIAQQIEEEIRLQIARSPKRPPCLAVILVGHHAPSHIYVNRKAQACARVGIMLMRRHFQDDVTEIELLQELQSLNLNPAIDAILVQLPLPKQIDRNRVIATINPRKDVDGLHPLNMGKLLVGEDGGFVPCTPLGVKELLVRSQIPIEGKHVVVMGRSALVGKPMAALLLRNASGGNATVTVVHSYTENLASITNQADILIVAMGKPKSVSAGMVKQGAVVIDVGINKIEKPEKVGESLIVGDTDFESLKERCLAITPVPGGIGPMTIAMLLSNTLKSWVESE